MFGGLATAPSSSPHLRKSGSRPVFVDPGNEAGNNVEEGFLQTEANGVKVLGSPMTTVAIMPSPVLLWRFKVGWDSVMRMSADLRDLFLYEAFLYYNPLLLVCATWMTIVVPSSMTAYLYLYSHGEVSLAASQPV
ncbi:hypothetical protein Patl1_02067 [Pistacia atlantica]|uniref:Uncharacterized protein n=1 Tax=Pistacia atlantica TaxID=434234 RepID=A0ACC1CCY9_9ROSI|nr:hypothetical protein Patl1_02067 [Pistacia atlantica]